MGDFEDRPHRPDDPEDTLSDDLRRETGVRTLTGTRLESPTPDQVLSVVLHLARAISVEMRDEEIVHAYVDALKSLFPRRLFAIRLVSPSTGKLAMAYATERLREERLKSPSVSRQAIERHQISPELTPHHGIRIVEAYSPMLQNCAGFDVPMMDGERMVGVLSVDYPPGVADFAEDQPIVAQLGLQLGAALRNARLLRESLYLKDYLSKLLENASAPILVMGHNRKVRVVNRALLKLTGLERDDVLGMDFSLLLLESEHERLLPMFNKALSGEPVQDFEVKLPRRTGGFARLAMNTVSIQSPEGEIEGVIAIGRDLTEVRELEEQIIQAEKLATLGQLAAGVVHELNNPLTSISVYGEYLLKKYNDSVIEGGDVEKIRRIVQSADRILRFTRDLVTYARPSNEPATHVSMYAALEQSLVFCEHVIAESGAVVHRDFGKKLPEVYAVKEHLHQVFINLITNACHAMPQGAGVLRVKAFEREEHVCVTMTDNGAGIPPDHLSEIFEPFFSTKGEGKGTGLGLSIVRNIVQQHNGRVSVTSQVGGGTTFEIMLPRWRDNF